MAVTVREKEHWKKRITRKIDQAIEGIFATEDPAIFKKIRRSANEQALESLGIAHLKKKIDDLDAQKATLEKKRQVVLKEVLAKILNVNVESLPRSPYSLEDHDIRSSVDRRTELYETELLAESEIGRRILKLREEKEELLDTVWLATSPKQVKELWQSVADVLKQEPTCLQHEALKINPLDEPNDS